MAERSGLNVVCRYAGAGPSTPFGVAFMPSTGCVGGLGHHLGGLLGAGGQGVALKACWCCLLGAGDVLLLQGGCAG